MRLSTADQQYIVNWRTDQSRLDPALTYRVRVLVGTLELGFADVDLVRTTKELRNVQTSQFVPLLNGTTLAIKFRIEQGFVAQITVAPSDATVVAALTQRPSGPTPPRSQTWAYRARSIPVENTPACPATPPMATAF